MSVPAGLACIEPNTAPRWRKTSVQFQTRCTSLFHWHVQESIDDNYVAGGPRPARDRGLRFSWGSEANLIAFLEQKNSAPADAIGALQLSDMCDCPLVDCREENTHLNEERL